MKRFAALILALAGCLPTQEAATPLGPATLPLRNPTAPIASQVNVDPIEFAGSWRVSSVAGTDWLAAGATVQAAVSGLNIVLTAPLADCTGEACFTRISMRNTADGRWAVAEGASTFSGEIWLLWTDVGRRTVAFGSPEGDVLVLLDKALPISPDRRAAARDILRWYGYDLSRLRGN